MMTFQARCDWLGFIQKWSTAAIIVSHPTRIFLHLSRDLEAIQHPSALIRQDTPT